MVMSLNLSFNNQPRGYLMSNEPRVNNRITLSDRNTINTQMVRPITTQQQFIIASLGNEPDFVTHLRSVQPAAMRQAVADMGLAANLWVSRSGKTVVRVEGVGIIEFKGASNKLAGTLSYDLWSISPKFRDNRELLPLVPENHPWHSELAEWVEVRQQFARDKILAERWLNAVRYTLNTPGQWARAWPESVPLLPPKFRSIVAGQTRASRMPYDWDRKIEGLDRKAITSFLMACKLAHDANLKSPAAQPGVVNASIVEEFNL
jgi:hypothetical protein